MPKLMMGALARQRIFVPGKVTRRAAKAGAEPTPKKLGRVHSLVFSPDSRRVVGMMVKRPDIAGMVKQKDRFVPLDAIAVHEGGVLCRGEKGDFDEPACQRLALDLDRCIVWEGADVLTEAGKQLGHVMDARFDATSGEVDCFCAQEGSTATALVGSFEIPAAWVRGYSAGRMIVANEAAGLELSGGLAGKAGEGYAAAKESAKKTAAKVDAKAAAAVDKGSRALGGAIGRAKVAGKRMAKESGAPGSGKEAAAAVSKQLGKTKGMFSGFMREFKDASK